MKKPLVIFLMGKAQSGKDTLADLIAEEIEYGYKGHYFSVVSMAFADILKVHCRRNHGYHDKNRDRDILLEIGDEMRQIDKNVFIKPIAYFMDIYGRMGYEVFIITDMRYSNEFESLKQMVEMVPFVIRVQGIYEHKNVSIFAKNHPTENLQFMPDYNVVLPVMDKKSMPEITEEIRNISYDILERYINEVK